MIVDWMRKTGTMSALIIYLHLMLPANAGELISGSSFGMSIPSHNYLRAKA